MFKTGRHRAPNQGELPGAALLGGKKAAGLYGNLKRLSLVEIAPQPLVDERAERVKDVDRKRGAFEKTPRF